MAAGGLAEQLPGSLRGELAGDLHVMVSPSVKPPPGPVGQAEVRSRRLQVHLLHGRSRLKKAWSQMLQGEICPSLAFEVGQMFLMKQLVTPGIV